MMGVFLSRTLILVFGYVYPAYECYKTVELNKAEIEQLRFWCQYWILVAVLAVLEIFCDIFCSWLPMYSEAKLVLYIFLWYPKLRGTSFVYDTFLRPFIAKHETKIDRCLLELGARAADIMFLFWQKATSYGRTSVFEMLNHVIVLVQAPRARLVQKIQQPEQLQQEESLSSPAPTARQPAAYIQETKFPPSLIKKHQQEQHGSHLRPATPAQPHQSSSPMSPSHRPPTSPLPPRDRRLHRSPLKNQMQEQLQKSGAHLKPMDGSETANPPSPREEQKQTDTVNSQDVEHPDPPSDESSDKGVIRPARDSLRKRAANASSAKPV